MVYKKYENSMQKNRDYSKKIKAFERLLGIMDDLRTGCPWDQKQTWDSLRILTIEEMYELVDAVLAKDAEGIKEEIGDLMMHMVFYALIGEEEQAFDLADALEAICDKLVVRHPHIYGDVEVSGAGEVRQNWEQIKLSTGKKSLLAGVPDALPAMVKAYRLQEKTATVGFEWESLSEVWDKVEEEIGELQQEVQLRNSQDSQANHKRIEEEFGDVLFALVNYGRFLGVDPEAALEKVNKRFKKRFEYIESNAPAPLNEMCLDEMNALWEKAKKRDS